MPAAHFSRRLALAAACMAVGPLLAAPVPKGRDDKAADLTGLYALVNRVAEKGEWTAADRGQVEVALRRLLDNLTAAGELPPRKPPADFDTVETITLYLKQTNLVQTRKACAVVKGGRFTQVQDSILLVAGDADLIQPRNCVVVATGKVKASQARGCVIVAGQSLEASQCMPARTEKRPADSPPKPGADGCVLVAGARMKLSQCSGAIAYVVKPDPAAGDEKPIEARQTWDTLYLNPEGLRKAGPSERNCRTAEPKSPPAK